MFVAIHMKKSLYHIHLFHKKSKVFSLKNPNKKHHALVFSASYSKNLNHSIETLQDHLGKNNFFGAVAGGDNTSIPSGSIFYNGKYYSKSTLAWCIDQSAYNLKGISIQDFHPIGFEFEITKVEKYTIIEIQGRPALAVIQEIIGEISDEDIRSFEYPFFIESKEHNNPIAIPLSTLKSINRQKQTLTLFKDVYKGNKLRLSIPLSRSEKEKCLRKTAQYHKKNALAFLFSCVPCQAYWGEMEALHLMHLEHSLNVPLVGFHSDGEIGPLSHDDCSLLQNQTLTLAVLSEKESYEVH